MVGNSLIQQFDNSLISLSYIPTSRSEFRVLRPAVTEHPTTLDSQVKEPPYNPFLEINALREGRLDHFGARFNLETALSEIYRLGRGLPYYLEIREDGFLYPEGGIEKLIDICEPDRQVTEIDKLRAPFDQKGVYLLNEMLREVQEGKRKDLRTVMISPNIGLGFVMIEITESVGTGKDARLKAERLAIPLDQLENRDEFEVFGELARRLTMDGRFQNVNSFEHLLGEVISLDESFDPFSRVDSLLKNILNKDQIYYGFEKLSNEEQRIRFKTILEVMQGDIADYLSFNAYWARKSDAEVQHNRQRILNKRNILINQFLDYKKEIKENKVISRAYINITRSKQETQLTRDASGFCPPSFGVKKYIRFKGMLVEVPEGESGSIAKCVFCRSKAVHYPNLKCQSCGLNNPDFCNPKMA